MTSDEAGAVVRDHYVPCCDEAREILTAARVLLEEVARLKLSNADLRDQRDTARARVRGGEVGCNLSDGVREW